MARIEWKPISSHNNKNVGPVEFRFLNQSGSHHHPFALNWEHSASQVRRGALPIAVPIAPEPTFEEVVALVGREFRVSPTEWLIRPLWQELWT